jgi:hypothetical protein
LQAGGHRFEPGILHLFRSESRPSLKLERRCWRNPDLAPGFSGRFFDNRIDRVTT